MKQKTLFILLGIINFINLDILCQETEHIITFFAREYPTTNKTKKVSKIPINFGLFSTYAGYLAISDINGQIIFPRKTIKPSLNLLITDKVSPVFMLGNTIAYWQIDKDAQAKMYTIERKFDNQTQSYFWDVNEQESPKNNIIPLHTIIIFANPENIYVPTGITLTDDNPQLFLPNIYVKKEFAKVNNALFVLNIKPFFETLKKLYKISPLAHDSIITS